MPFLYAAMAPKFREKLEKKTERNLSLIILISCVIFTAAARGRGAPTRGGRGANVFQRRR